MSRIADAVDKSLITFITAGDPDKESTIDFLLVLSKYADVLELGIPFSDPIADGKTIQQAHFRALKSGTKIRDVFEISKHFKELSDKPLILMTYFNPVYSMGISRFVEQVSSSGIDGLLVVDLPVEEASFYIEECRKANLGRVFLTAPNTSEKRLRVIDEESDFIYLISTYGVTGERKRIDELALNAVKKLKHTCSSPVAVGFGISKSEHVNQLIEAGADGVVVGSALVRLIGKYRRDAALYIEERVKELKEAMK
jgi:tryptophan synthase alpha chain